VLPELGRVDRVGGHHRLPLGPLGVGDLDGDRAALGLAVAHAADDAVRAAAEAEAALKLDPRDEDAAVAAARYVAQTPRGSAGAIALLESFVKREPKAIEARFSLARLLAAEGVATSFHRDRALPTTVKLRVIGRQQQLLRIDFETTPSHEILADKLASLGAEPATTPAPVKVTRDAKEMLQTALKAEVETLDRYIRRRKQADEAGEYGLSVHLDDIIADETHHRDELQQMLARWP